MKVLTSSSTAKNKNLKTGKLSSRYATQTYDYLKYLVGRNHQNYGANALVLDESYQHFCNAD